MVEWWPRIILEPGSFGAAECQNLFDGPALDSATKYERPALRCSDCFKRYVADLPEGVKEDEKFDSDRHHCAPCPSSRRPLAAATRPFLTGRIRPVAGTRSFHRAQSR